MAWLRPHLFEGIRPINGTKERDAFVSTLTYQCPSCAAPLHYAGENGQLSCGSCGCSFDPADIAALAGAGESSEIEFALPTEQFSAGDAGDMRAFVCRNCGAELMTDGTTTATECGYCGSSVVLSGQIEGGTKPEKVVPFRLKKEQAAALFEQYFRGKRLLPNIFLNTRNRIADMRKLYVPYWLFDCDASADIWFDAEKTHISRKGDWEVRRTQYYLVHRSGSLGFDAIPVDGSAKLDDKIGESLEPYDVGEAVPFQPAVLAGAMADRADVDAEACQARAIERVERSIEKALEDTVEGYSRVSVRRKNIQATGGRVTPVLMPVWLMTVEKREKGKEKTYTFAANGQSGELTCDVPYDKRKAALWFLGLFAGVFAVGYAALVALHAMGVIG